MARYFVRQVVPALLLIGCVRGAPGPGPAHDAARRPVEEFYEASGVRQILDATDVFAMRVDADDWQVPGKLPDSQADRVLGFRVFGKVRRLPAEVRKQFQTLLLDPTVYTLPGPNEGFGNLCGGFRPGVALRFRGPQSIYDVLVCFACNEIGIVDPSPWKSDAAVAALPNNYIATTDITHGRTRVLRYIAEVFADDSEIQDLWRLEPSMTDPR